jgi:hypothetical protein
VTIAQRKDEAMVARLYASGAYVDAIEIHGGVEGKGHRQAATRDSFDFELTVPPCFEAQRELRSDTPRPVADHLDRPARAQSAGHGRLETSAKNSGITRDCADHELAAREVDMKPRGLERWPPSIDFETREL